MKRLLHVILLSTTTIAFLNAQVINNIELPTVINDTNTSVVGPDESAILELISAERGLLIPRMTEIDKNAIMNPATGLLVYQRDGRPGFYYYDGAIWQPVNGGTVSAGNTLEDLDSDTKIQVEEGPDDDVIRFDIENTEYMTIDNTGLRLTDTNNGALLTGRFDTGNVGIGCSNPSAKLSLCGGEIAFSAGFNGDPGDKISLNGYNIENTNMVGIGYETSLYNINGLFFNLDDFYYKAQGGHRWYNNVNANGGSAASMVLNREGYLGIGTNSPRTSLHVETGEDASLTEDGLLMLGDNSLNLVFGGNEIQARANGVGSNLNLQVHGGDILALTGGGNLITDLGTFVVDGSADRVGVGTGFGTIESKFQVFGGADVSLTNHGYIMMGASTSTNIAMDNNEIQARNNGAEAPLYIQREGGNVGLGITSSTVPAKLSIQDASMQLHLQNENDTSNDWYIGASGPTWLAGEDRLVISPTTSSTSSMLTFRSADDVVDVQRSGGDVLLCGQANGQVGIGVSNPDNIPEDYILAVDGNIMAEEVRVELSSSWPDYVFQDDYELRSIEQLEKSIEENGHLPGIPSAEEIEEVGIHVGDMQRRMMEKIEELSLYIIQLNEDNKELRGEIESLKASINTEK